MNLKFEVTRYLENDVVATSCPAISGMSSKSYEFCSDNICGWCVNDLYSEMYGDYRTDFKYYDDKGTLQTKNGYSTSESWGLDGKFFHYKEDASAPSGYVFEICNSASHRKRYH